MQARVGPVALNCLKIGGAGTLLSAPLGLISLAAGEATYAGGIATMLVAGAVARVADRREMARATLAARRVLARAKVTAQQGRTERLISGGKGDVVITFGGGSTGINGDGVQT